MDVLEERAATFGDVANPPPVTPANADEEGSTPPVDKEAILVVIGISPDACSPPIPALNPERRGISPEACSPPIPALKPVEVLVEVEEVGIPVGIALLLLVLVMLVG